MKSVRHVTLVAIFLFFVATSISVQAQCRRNCPPPPVLTVLGEWAPSEQLSTLGADVRTVELNMRASTDRPFWAMDISCYISQLGIFSGDAADQTMTWGAGWKAGNEAQNYFDPSEASGIYYDDTSNRINATVTRVGASNSPVGLNGVDYVEDLFSLELTISDGLVGTNNITLDCDQLDFLDRNGNSLGQINYSGKTLVLRDGYSITGDATRQGTENKDEIEVTCTHSSGREYDSVPLYTYTYDRRGNIQSQVLDGFQFNQGETDGEPLRDFGFYRCDYVSMVGGSENDVFLRGSTYLNLQTATYDLQGVALLSGDVDGNGEIDVVGDLPFITANWQQAQTPFEQGDVNGDGFVNESDLAIAAGNVGLGEDAVTETIAMDHVVYSAARDYNDDFPNNHLLLGNAFAGAVTDLNVGLTVTEGSGRRAVTYTVPVRAFWPQVSPDGSRLIYYFEGEQTITEGRGRNATTYTVPLDGLIIANTDDFGGTTLANGKNFAPSWSPSGNQIGYICSWEDYNNGVLGFKHNNGNLCVISASGGAVQTIVPPGASSTYAEIFPPAWYDDNTLIYAGNADHPICPDQLCYYDMLTDTHGLIPVHSVNGTTLKANMPVIKPFINDLTYLFYRTFDESDSELAMGTVTYDSENNTWISSGVLNAVDVTDEHQTVDNVDGIHYYDVSPMLDVMYYEFGEYLFHNLHFDSDTFTWSEGATHSVDNFIGYPMTVEDGFTSTWDGYSEDETSATDFHAYRPTFDWLP